MGEYLASGIGKALIALPCVFQLLHEVRVMLCSGDVVSPHVGRFQYELPCLRLLAPNAHAALRALAELVQRLGVSFFLARNHVKPWSQNFAASVGI